MGPSASGFNFSALMTHESCCVCVCVCVFKRIHVHWGSSYTWKGVLIRLTSVSKMWTLSCWWRRMKERKVCSSAGSVTLLRKRSRYAVVVITSSRVSLIEAGGQSVGSYYRTTEHIMPEKDLLTISTVYSKMLGCYVDICIQISV